MKNIKILNNKKLYKILVCIVLSIFIIQPLAFSAISAFANDEQTQVPQGDPPEGEGTDGEDGEVEGDTVIVTGDGLVIIEVTNKVNQNEYNEGESENEPVSADPAEDTATSSEDIIDIEDTGTASSKEATSTPEIIDEEETATSTEDLLLNIDIEENNASTTATSTDLLIENENKATTTNEIDGEGNSGENGIDGGEGDSIIDTGDVGIGSGVVNDVNYNDTNVSCEGCDNEATSTARNIEVNNDNNATTTNDIDLEGNSGENEINNTEGDSLINTGDVGIISILINYINNNFFGNGKEFFVNIFNHVKDTLDFSGFFDDEEPDEENIGGCEDNNCSLTINNDNTANIQNDIIIDANTGENVIASTSGEAVIATGDIDIANDVLNIANLNITGDEWFFAVVNVFGELEGDIVLPGIDDEDIGIEESSEEEANLTNSESNSEEMEQTGEYIITNSNIADAVNDININANTGENEISSSSEAMIITGDADVTTNTFNLINYNIYGDTWKFARVNVFGHWEGFIHGLPEGYNYYQDELGVTIYNDFLDDPALYSRYANLSVDNNNVATTTNNIEINANSGDNSILHSSGGGSIMTGDINIVNSLFNFINSNFTGDNWEFSMVNVFGEWQGNLAFGRPELWITESNDSVGVKEPGDYVTYNFLFGNNGDGIATDVLIVDDFNEIFMNVFESGGGLDEDGIVVLELGDLPPNSQGSFSYTVQVNSDVPPGENESVNTAIITSNETDRDMSNNSASGSVSINGGSGGGSSFHAAGTSSGGGTDYAGLVVLKTNNAKTVVYPGDTVDFQVYIKDTGNGPMEEVWVIDVMTNEESGKEISRDFWDLETVFGQEEIILDYTVEIKNNIESGTYINEVIVEGYDVNRGKFISAVASSKIKVDNPEFGKLPQIEIGRIDNINPANPGDEVEYELVVVNNGGATAENVTIMETLPTPLTFKDGGGNIKDWHLGNIKPGEIKNIYYIVSIPSDARKGIYKIMTEHSADNIEYNESIALLKVNNVEVLGVENDSSPVVDDKKNYIPSINEVEDDHIIDLNLGVKTAEASTLKDFNDNNKNSYTFFYITMLLLILLIIAITVLQKVEKRINELKIKTRRK